MATVMKVAKPMVATTRVVRRVAVDEKPFEPSVRLIPTGGSNRAAAADLGRQRPRSPKPCGCSGGAEGACSCPSTEPLSPALGEEERDMDKMFSPASPQAMPRGGWAPDQVREARAAGQELPSNWMPGVDFTPGGTVVCDGATDPKAYKLWINPTNPAWLAPCVRAHEQKHKDDFDADADYKPAKRCVGIDNGKIWGYGNGHAKRFECAASDIEINCIKSRAPGLPISERTQAFNRMNQMQEYRRSNGCAM